MVVVLAFLLFFVMVGEVILFSILFVTKSWVYLPLTFSRIIFNVLTVLLFSICCTAFLADEAVLNNMKLTDEATTRTHLLDKLRDTIADMESSQRGYLLTHRKYYLDPYTANRGKASDLFLQVLEAYRDKPRYEQVTHCVTLAEYKIGELAAVIDLESEGKHQDAIDRIKTDEGKKTMDLFRTVVDNLKVQERLDSNTLKDQSSDLLRWLSRVKLVLVLACIALMIIDVISEKRLARKLHLDPSEANVSTMIEVPLPQLPPSPPPLSR